MYIHGVSTDCNNHAVLGLGTTTDLHHLGYERFFTATQRLCSLATCLAHQGQPAWLRDAGELIKIIPGFPSYMYTVLTFLFFNSMYDNHTRTHPICFYRQGGVREQNSRGWVDGEWGSHKKIGDAGELIPGFPSTEGFVF